MDLIQIFDDNMHALAGVIGKPDDQIRLMVMLFISYPIAYMFRHINGEYVRHAYSIIVGNIMHYMMFREDIIHYWAVTLMIYAIIYLLPRRIAAYTAFAVAIGYLSVCHIYRVIYDYGSWRMDGTTYLMPLASKLSTLGFCVWDGIMPDSKLDDYQRSKKLTKIPQLYEVLSYTAFPGTNMMGPFIEFKDFKDFIEKKGVFAHIPSPVLAGIQELFLGVFSLGLYVVIPSYFD